MKSDLKAMEAAQAGDPCPAGFSERRFRVLQQQAADGKKRHFDQSRGIYRHVAFLI
jgi:hypothetical protein